MKAVRPTRFVVVLLLLVASAVGLGCSCGGDPTAVDASDRFDAAAPRDAPTSLDAPASSDTTPLLDPAPVDAPTPLDAFAPVDAPGSLDAPSLPDAPADAPGTTDAAGCAPGTGSTTLPALTVGFPPQRCVYTLAEAAAGITLAYEVNVASAVTIEQMLNCESGGPSGAVVVEAVQGGGQRYCVCDTGLCFPTTITPTLVPGSYPSTLPWTGRNWDGPSDTGMPLGPPFPAGDYAFDVRITGTSGGAGFVVTGSLPIRLVP